jgi:hypothetical protein
MNLQELLCQVAEVSGLMYMKHDQEGARQISRYRHAP